MADRLLRCTPPEEEFLSEQPEKILVVDDDEAIRTLVERILRREKFHVECARDGFEAIEKISRNDYATILLDIMMPRVDGLQVLRFLEAQCKSTKPSVIVMTANTHVAAQAEASKPLFRVLSKPFDIRQLVEHVRECVTLDRSTAN
jgi:DNA-binding response OmpR family regulator